MNKTFRLILLACVLALAACAMAIYPSMTNTLIGTPTNGQTPSGEIKVDQSKLPNSPATVQIKMKNVNLPNGTMLNVTIDGQLFGMVTVNNGQVNGSISTFLMTGRNADIYITLPSGITVASQLSAWKV